VQEAIARLEEAVALLQAALAQAPVRYVNRTNREALIKALPALKGMSANAIREAVVAEKIVLPAGWALPTGHVREQVKGKKGKKA
jgi:hypothetical protein